MRDSSVGVAIRYGLKGPEIVPVGARFYALIQTGPGAQTASCAMGARSLSRGQSGRGVALTTHPDLAPRLQEERSSTSTPPLGLRTLLYLYLYHDDTEKLCYSSRPQPLHHPDK